MTPQRTYGLISATRGAILLLSLGWTLSSVPAAAQGTAYDHEIRPIDSLRYVVPQDLLIDYVRLTTKTIPAYESLAERYRRLIRQDSLLIAQQRREIEAYERQEIDMDRIVTLYEEEILRRRKIEALYDAELRRMKWWRRGAIAGAVGILTLAVLR